MSLIDSRMKDRSMFEKRLAEIQAMPEGPERDEEIRKLSLDYPGMLEDLASQREFAEGLATGDMPKGGVAGPASNPFSYYVAANPVEHAAAGAQKYLGWKERQKAMDEIAKTRSASENETFKLLKAGASDPALQKTQAGMLRGLSPEEEERRKRMMMYGGWGGGQVSA